MKKKIAIAALSLSAATLTTVGHTGENAKLNLDAVKIGGNGVAKVDGRMVAPVKKVKPMRGSELQDNNGCTNIFCSDGLQNLKNKPVKH